MARPLEAAFLFPRREKKPSAVVHVPRCPELPLCMRDCDPDTLKGTLLSCTARKGCLVVGQGGPSGTDPPVAAPFSWMLKTVKPSFAKSKR